MSQTLAFLLSKIHEQYTKQCTSTEEIHSNLHDWFNEYDLCAKRINTYKRYLDNYYNPQNRIGLRPHISQLQWLLHCADECLYNYDHGHFADTA